MQHEPRSRCDPAQPTGLPKQARGRPRGSQIGPPPRWLPGAAAQPRGAAAQLLSQLLPCFRHGFRTSKLQSRSRAAAAQSPGSTPTSVPHTQLLRAAPRAVLQLPRLPPAQQARALPPQTPSRAASRQPARLHTCQARLPGRPSVRRTESCLHPHGTSTYEARLLSCPLVRRTESCLHHHGTSTYEARLLSCPSWATIVGAHRGRPSWAPIVGDHRGRPSCRERATSGGTTISDATCRSSNGPRPDPVETMTVLPLAAF
eukprot:scaffold1886_cov38-Phaeocystis_antarctica.AAC.3